MSDQLTLEEFFKELSKAIRALRAYPHHKSTVSDRKLMWFKVPGAAWDCYCPIALVRRSLGQATQAENAAAIQWTGLESSVLNSIIEAADDHRENGRTFNNSRASYARKRLRDLARRARRFSPRRPYFSPQVY